VPRPPELPTRRPFWRRLGMACVAALLLCRAAFAQQPAGPDKLPPPRPTLPELPDVGRVGYDGPAVPITLAAALEIALAANLDIAQARAAVDQARAALLRARTLGLPNLALGSTYTHHEGQIQKTEGNIITANKDSLFVGGGPTMSFQTVDALLGPLVAHQLRDAAEAAFRRTNNNTLLAVADAYFNVQRARRRLARIDDTLDFLTSDRPTAMRGGLKGLLPLVRDVVEVGGKEAFLSDMARVQVEVLRRREERVAAVQDYRVASAELSRLLVLDPEIPLMPLEDIRYPMPLPGEEWQRLPAEELVRVAMANRPELAENQALVQATLDQVKIAKVRPLLPNPALNYNWGGFGGGPDPNPPIVRPPARPGGAPTVVSQPGFGPSGRILRFDTRTDFDVGLYWRLNGAGLGNLAEIREQQARYRQAQARRQAAVMLVATQVVQAREQVQDWRERLIVARSALFDEQGQATGPVFRALRLNFERVRGGEGRPLEVQDAIRLLSDLLEAYATATTDYERSRFRLLYSLGLPPQHLVPAAPGPPPADGASAPAPQVQVSPPGAEGPGLK